MGLANQPFGDLLSAVAEPTPAPGGGSSAALTAALAAALVEMAARIEESRGGPPEPAARARALRLASLELAERELTAYEPVLQARRLARDDPQRGERIAAALEEASRTPQQIAATADEVAELGTSVAAGCEPSVRGDAQTGVLLAQAAAAAARGLVEINRA